MNENSSFWDVPDVPDVPSVPNVSFRVLDRACSHDLTWHSGHKLSISGGMGSQIGAWKWHAKGPASAGGVKRLLPIKNNYDVYCKYENLKFIETKT